MSDRKSYANRVGKTTSVCFMRVIPGEYERRGDEMYTDCTAEDLLKPGKPKFIKVFDKYGKDVQYLNIDQIISFQEW